MPCTWKFASAREESIRFSCWMAMWNLFALGEEMKSAFYLTSWVRKWNTALLQMLKLAMMHGFSVCSTWSSSLFSILFSLSCLPDHCKWFPSFLFKWHLQMRGKSGRQWIWNWKRHWTEDNATGSIISNPNDLKCHMMWNCCCAGFLCSLSMRHFFQWSSI